jgi:hypothetical protein
MVNGYQVIRESGCRLSGQQGIRGTGYQNIRKTRGATGEI